MLMNHLEINGLVIQVNISSGISWQDVVNWQVTSEILQIFKQE